MAEYHLTARVVHGMRRRWRCLRRRWASHGVRFVYQRDYEYLVQGVPLDAMRAERILAFLADEGLVARGDIEIPRLASMRNLLRVHSAEYLESLHRPEVVERIFGVRLPDEAFERVVRIQRLMVGGTIQASRLARYSRGIAVNLGGGFHHAMRDQAMGFCVFNDVAIAIARLRARGFKEPILVVDLDLHDGNGTRAIFARDPSVYTYSVHAEDWGETTADASTAIPLGSDVGDELYLETVRSTLPDVFEETMPGLVFYLAGTDPAADDRLGNWRVSSQGMLSRDRFVVDLVRQRRRPVPLVIVLAGGYGDRAWRHTARFMTSLLGGRPLEPLDNEELTLARFRHVRKLIDPADLASEPGSELGFKLTDEDLVGIVPGAPRSTRFLGYFTTYGVEVLLEKLGILDQLRVRGFEDPSTDMDTAHPLGQTLRIWGEAERQNLLVELRANRSQAAVKGLEMVVLEWLLLQNPRADFGPYRRPLPGQKHPGLGLLKEFFGLLIVMCELLRLDGIVYSPSSYHVAAQSRKFVRFLYPEHGARFRALCELLGELPLDQASRAIVEGQIIEEGAGEVLSWVGCPMVLPVSERLKSRVYGAEYEAAVAQAMTGVSFRFAARTAGCSAPRDRRESG